MVKEDKQRFLSAMGTMFEVFGKEITDVVIKAYKMALSRYTIEQTEGAIARAITTMKWLPKPADLIDLMGGNVSDVAEVECSKAFRAISSVGCYESVCFDDPITQAVIVQYFGGWVKFCMETMEDTGHFRKKEFVKAYESYSRSNLKHGGWLAGIHEIQNNASGVEYKPAVKLIGNNVECQKVLALKTGNESLQISSFNMGNLTKQITGK